MLWTRAGFYWGTSVKVAWAAFVAPLMKGDVKEPAKAVAVALSVLSLQLPQLKLKSPVVLPW